MYRSNAGPEILNVENSCRDGRWPVAVLIPPLAPVIATQLVRDARHSVMRTRERLKIDMTMVVPRNFEGHEGKST